MLPVERTVCETPVLATALEQPRAVHQTGAVLFHLVTHWYGAILFVPLLLGLVVGPRTMKIFAESKVDIVKFDEAKYLNEAYPMWRRDHPTQECPRSLRALDGYMDHAHHLDPWGHGYVFTCGDGKPYMMSLGEDGLSNTADDIWSNQ